MNTGNKLRLKNGQVVTVIGISGQNLICRTAEGQQRFAARSQVCHIIGHECDTCNPKEKKEHDNE